MKRDMDLIRLILLKIEKEVDGEPVWDLSIEGYDMKQVAYHCKLLWEHGFIDEYSPDDGDDELLDFAVGSLTWEGHEYLDTVRDNGFWNKIKTVMKDKMIPMTLSFVISTAEAFVCKQLGL